MNKYKMVDSKSKEYIIDLYDLETAELYAHEMGLTLIGKVEIAS